MCGTDFTVEAMQAPNFPELFKSVAHLKKARSCWVECGIVEVEIVKKRWRRKSVF